MCVCLKFNPIYTYVDRNRKPADNGVLPRRRSRVIITSPEEHSYDLDLEIEEDIMRVNPVVYDTQFL